MQPEAEIDEQPPVPAPPPLVTPLSLHAACLTRDVAVESPRGPGLKFAQSVVACFVGLEAPGGCGDGECRYRSGECQREYQCLHESTVILCAKMGESEELSHDRKRSPKGLMSGVGQLKVTVLSVRDSSTI